MTIAPPEAAATSAATSVDGGDALRTLAELLRHGDESAARRTLRAQIARLERQLDAGLVDADASTRRRHLAAPLADGSGPRMLDLGELERVRDALAQRGDDVRAAAVARARAIARTRARLDAMLLDPAAHRGVTITAEDLGEDVCRRWKAVPVLGVVGRLAGWWRVRISSGCP